jgi:oxygen-independent coproporphyrinogen-3 oxidase
LPTAQQKIELFTLVAKKLIAAGYVHIGMDHFVKKTDALYDAQQQAKLQRNFQGYSTCLAPDLVGLGVSAISSMDNRYVQNATRLEDYYQQLANDTVPISKGISLSNDDC